MKRIIISSVTMGLMLSLVETVSAFSGASSGTEEEPYIITDVNQLQEIQEGLSAWYELGNDIDASATSGWNDGEGFTPIGDNSDRFTGHFDGNDFTISGLYINRSSAEYVGLFGCTGTESEIENVGLEDVSIAGGITDTGGVSGYTHNGIISGCYTTGNITGSGNTGGLVGYNDGSVTDSYFTGNVNGNGNYVGGLVGRNCVTITISNSYSTGSVSGNRNYSYTGGLVGENKGAISNSCSTASASGGEYVGGLVGRNNDDSTINDSYSTGGVSGEVCLGGLAGWNNGTCESCFWDKTVHPDLQGTGGGNITGITGKTTVEMQTKSTFTDADWDFDNVWDIKQGQTYPFLKALAFCGDQWHSYPVGDLNYDCHVDLYDFATFTTHWLECTAPECD